MGKLLDIDLNNASYSEMQLNPSMLRDFIGGRGLGAKLLYDLLPQGVDPLS
ncbi:MAG TPA: aldehyde ferredoxin oxidoreductase N-terminal domain-containing protein, partial [Bacillota bacterium]|nr:aldehyde ferredoxin oxidoreductase N-terminal domain-containing protein [Bacillota bacterium]